MRDVNSGWAVRYTHANVASFFFIFVYAQHFKFIISNILFYSNNKIISLCKLPLYCYHLFNKAISDTFLKIFNRVGLSKSGHLVQRSHAKNIDNKFLQWFIGFIDAEGNFQTTKVKRINIQGNITHYTLQYSFHLSIHIRDTNLIKHIKKMLNNKGNIFYYEKRNEVHYSIAKKRRFNLIH